MGTLAAMHYPLSDQADHTYVQCINGGASWSCWGGKTGGALLRQGAGSTARADRIAQPDEKANIKCYLINGVCHQAANRILLPARITVRGARGYSVSQALYGTYGRVGFWPCKSTFRRYPNASGDLPACVTNVVGGVVRTDADKLDDHYIRRELDLLTTTANSPTAVRALAVQLFMLMAEFHLGPMLDRTLERKLREVRGMIEIRRIKVEAAFSNNELTFRQFANAVDEVTLELQREMVSAMSPVQYETLFDLTPGDEITLANPEVVSGEQDQP